MTRLTDGKRIAEITMNKWDGNGYTPDWSGEFFEVGGCQYDAENDCYVVDDIDYCIKQAQDCIDCIGDYAENTKDENDNLDINIITIN